MMALPERQLAGMVWCRGTPLRASPTDTSPCLHALAQGIALSSAEGAAVYARLGHFWVRASHGGAHWPPDRRCGRTTRLRPGTLPRYHTLARGVVRYGGVVGLRRC
jgi:hypothetical protein